MPTESVRDFLNRFVDALEHDRAVHKGDDADIIMPPLPKRCACGGTVLIIEEQKATYAYGECSLCGDKHLTFSRDVASIGITDEPGSDGRRVSVHREL